MGGHYPAAFPDLTLHTVIALDTETTGVGHLDVPVGVSFALPTGVSGYNAWGHAGGGNNCTLDQVRTWLAGLQPGTTVVMHNALFDLRMLKNVGIDLIRAGVIIHDTGFMAAIHYELERSFSLGNLAQKRLGVPGKSDTALNEWCAMHFGGAPTRSAQAKHYWRTPVHVIHEYAVDDAILTLQLWEWYRANMHPDTHGVLQMEHDLIPVLFRMNQQGVRVDLNAALAHEARIAQELEALHTDWDRLTNGIPISGPGSQKGLRDLWVKAGLPFSHTPTGQVSITKAHVAEAGDHPLARTLHEVRVRDKVLNTFLRSYFIEGNVSGRIHTTLHPLRTDEYGAVSGRFSSSDPNLQNLPSPDKDDPSLPVQDQYGKLIRTLVLPEDGCQWVKADMSQIEYRFFAHYAGGQIRQAYLDDPEVDFHGWCADTAGAAMGRTVARGTAKNGNFAKLYGAGIGRLAATLGISVDAAREFMTAYDAAIPEAASLYQDAMAKAKRRGYIITWGGRKRHFRRGTRGFERTHAALNALLQGSSADQIKRAMLVIDRDILDWQNTFLHITVHDELDFSAPLGAAGDTFMRRVKEAMEDFDLTVPVRADVEHGPTWGELKDWKP